MNIFIKAGLIALGIIGVSVGCSNSGFASPLSNAASSVYKLYESNDGICSAVAVSDIQLVTAAHCIKDGGDYTLVFDNVDPNSELATVSQTVMAVKPIRVLRDKDVALLELVDPTVKIGGVTYDFRLNKTRVCSKDDYEIGDRMYAIGYPAAMELTITEGMYTGLASLKNDLNISGLSYKTTVPVIGGNSGGGLFVNDADGLCLTGITSATYNAAFTSFMSYFSRLDKIEEVTKDILRDKKGSYEAGKLEEVFPIQ